MAPAPRTRTTAIPIRMKKMWWSKITGGFRSRRVPTRFGEVPIVRVSSS